MQIYKATNILNDKSYIGLTKELNCRQRRHYDDAIGGSPTHFHRAIRKYGMTVFEWEILAECSTREEAGNLEIELISEHDTFANGYNMTTGGESGWTVTDEIHQKIIDAARARPRPSAESNAKRSATMKGRVSWNKGLPSINKGKPQPRATCEYCGHIGGAWSMKGHHFENCKMKDKKTIDDLDNLITTSTIQIGAPGRSASHCAALSKSTKEFYKSEAGIEEKKLRSERTKKYWDSPEGQAKKERLRKKLKKA